MTGISFTNGGGFSFEGRNSPDNRNTLTMTRGVVTPKSYKRSTSGLQGHHFNSSGLGSPSAISTSITMGDPGSFSTSSQMFGLGTSNPMLSSSRRSYAAAVSGQYNLSSSFASMSFQPMSLGVSYTKNQVLDNMFRSDPARERYTCCAQVWVGLIKYTEHCDKVHPEGFNENEIPVPLSQDEQLLETELDDLEIESRDVVADYEEMLKPTIPHYALPPPTTSSSDKGTPREEIPDPTTEINLAEFIQSPIKSPYMATKPGPPTGSSNSTPPDGASSTPPTSNQHSPVAGPHKSNIVRNFLPAQYQPAQANRFDRAFNDVVIGSSQNKDTQLPTHIAPGLLGGSTAKNLGIPTVPPTGPGGQVTAQPEGEVAKEPVLPEPSLFATTKPWRCPNPGCNKAYKQSNGLKYHQSKG
jgi:transcription factor SFP1